METSIKSLLEMSSEVTKKGSFSKDELFKLIEVNKDRISQEALQTNGYPFPGAKVVSCGAGEITLVKLHGLIVEVLSFSARNGTSSASFSIDEWKVLRKVKL